MREGSRPSEIPPHDRGSGGGFSGTTNGGPFRAESCGRSGTSASKRLWEEGAKLSKDSVVSATWWGPASAGTVEIAGWANDWPEASP
jgi:hypothetical protein